MVAIITSTAFCKYLLSVLNVAILSVRKRFQQRHHCFGHRRPWTTTSWSFLYRTHLHSIRNYPLHSTKINLYNPPRQQVKGFKLVNSKSQLLHSFEWISFLSWEIFILILTNVLSIDMLHFILNYPVRAWLSVYTTVQAFKNKATTKENGNFLCNHKTMRHRNNHNKACRSYLI